MTIPEARKHPVLRRFPLRRRDVDARGGRLRIVAPESSQALLLGGWPPHEVPHWADIWAASVALARHLSKGPSLAGRTVVDLGCGVGVAGVAAGLRGARVVFADVDPNAVAFAAFNAGRNGLADYEARVFDWHRDRLPPCDLLLLCDVAYEYRHLTGLRRQILEATARGATALVVDPQRATANDLLRGLAAHCELDTERLATSWGGRIVDLRLVRCRGAAP